jgi:tripartite-type tricarboxylate transporter receptor subunit TctC
MDHFAGLDVSVKETSICKARIADFGGTVFALSPAGFGKFIADETDKWAKVIRAANIKPA